MSGEPAEIPAPLRERFAEPTLLGRGAFGRVVRARDRTLDRDVALKILDAGPKAGDRVEERFLREAKLTARIKSPYVTQVYDYGIAEGSPYIVFQFVDGPSLGALLEERGGKLDVVEATGYLIDILEGLVAAHEEGVVHRDLKPDNVLVDADGRAVLADFGLGKGQRDRRLTGTGMVVGTGETMAPEQMRGAEPAPTMDLYAAGVIYYRMLVGRPPFEAESFIEMFEKKMDGLEGSLQDAGVEVPAAADHVLERLLAPRVDERARSARMTVAALHDAFVKARRDGQPSYPSLASRTILQGSSVVGSSTAMMRALRARLPERAFRVRVLLGSALSAAALVLGFLLARDPPAPGAPPRPPTRAARPAEGGGLPDGARVRALEEAVAALEGHPQVREALTVPDAVDRRVARTTWELGRGVLRAKRPALHRMVDEVADAPPTPRLLGALSRLAMLEALFTHVRLEEVEPLYGGEEPPPVEEVLSRARRVARLDALDGQFPAARAERARLYAARLAARGRRWEPLRRLESIPVVVESEPILLNGLRRRGYYGDPFVETANQLNMYLRDTAKDIFNSVRDRRSPVEIELPVRPLEGSRDLVLALAVQGWDATVNAQLELVGTEATLRLHLRPPPEAPAPHLEAREWRVGVGVRVRSAVLPEGLRKLRLTARGIQALGNPWLLVLVDEVHQLVDGPLPEALEGPW